MEEVHNKSSTNYKLETCRGGNSQKPSGILLIRSLVFGLLFAGFFLGGILVYVDRGAGASSCARTKNFLAKFLLLSSMLIGLPLSLIHI